MGLLVPDSKSLPAFVLTVWALLGLLWLYLLSLLTVHAVLIYLMVALALSICAWSHHALIKNNKTIHDNI